MSECEKCKKLGYRCMACSLTFGHSRPKATTERKLKVARLVRTTCLYVSLVLGMLCVKAFMRPSTWGDETGEYMLGAIFVIGLIAGYFDKRIRWFKTLQQIERSQDAS